MSAGPAFLVVRLGALGDIVHALPVAAALRARWPDARIDWVVERRHAGVFDLFEGIDAVVPFQSRRIGAGEGWLGTVRRLRAAGYDVTFDAQGLIKSAILARAAGARRTVGFAAGYLREGAASVCYTETVAPAGVVHVVDKNLALLRAAGIDAPARAFPLKRVEAGDALTAALASAGGRFVLLNPGGGWPNKRWPPERFGEVAARLGARHGLASIVLWGPGDESLAASVVATAGGAARLAPRTTLADVLVLAQMAVLVVSGDTGPSHLASAAGTPVVGIYGPTDPARNGPWSPDDECVSRHDVCECSHLRRCRAARWCLADVTTDDVMGAIERRLEGIGYGL
jgi:heptosyltransferase-1